MRIVLPARIKHSYSSVKRTVRLAGLCAGLILFTLAALPSLAVADVQTIEFDTAPPPLGLPLDGQGDVSFPKALGFRPYRVEVGATRAHSGASVGDLGRCVQEAEASGKNPGSCEGFQAQTTGVLARTANSVSLFAGRIGPILPGEEPEQAILHAYDAAGNPLDTAGPLPLSESFSSHLEVSSAAGAIARFRVEAVSGPNGGNAGPDLGIDDLAVNFADGGEPDFAVSAPSEVLALVQGQELAVPVQISRVNGSNGPIELSVSDLPTGVSAAPVIVESSQSSATIVLRADPSAPDTDFTPKEATITADPLGNPNVGPAPRTTTVLVRVAAAFELGVGGYSGANPPPGDAVRIEVPDCAVAEVPFSVSRDIAMDRSISLSLEADTKEGGDLGAGLSTEILPGAEVPPGGNLVAHGTLRFRTAPGSDLALRPIRGFLVGTVGSGPAASTHRFPIELVRAQPHAMAEVRASKSAFALTPRFGKDGTPVHIHGTGFCPGTTVEVGNEGGLARPSLLDEHTLAFTVPRYATGGQVTINPPGGFASYHTDGEMVVDSVRNSDGFRFSNPDFKSLSLAEFTKAFGADDLFVRVNPCWPFGDCSVSTGFLDPIAAAEWGVMGKLFEAHCFGMVLGSLELTSGKEPYRQFTSGNRVYDLPNSYGPSSAVESFLDATQVRQDSAEFLEARLNHEDSLAAQLETLEREFAHGREVMISIKHGWEGHSLLAYDLVQTPGSAEIYAYDPNRPFQPVEEHSEHFHRQDIDSSTIRIDKAKRTWSFSIDDAPMPAATVWEGGDDGSLWAAASSSFPEDPSLPGLGTLYSEIQSVVFDSKGGAVRTVKGSGDAEFLPTAEAAPGRVSAGGGTWATDDLSRPLGVVFQGRRDGRYSQAYTAPGFIATASDVKTARGVRDRVEGDGETLTFFSGADRPLELKLARDESATLSTTATLDTHASAEGADTAGIAADGALTYAHEGAPTTARFTLTTVRRNGGPATFVSGPVRVGRGDRLRVKPLGRNLGQVRLVVRGANGRNRTRLLRNRGRAQARLALGAPRISGHRLSLRLSLAGVHGRAILGATLRLMHGLHLVARKAVALRNVTGARRLTWKLPHRVKRGHYRLLADVRAIVTGAPGATSTASASARRRARIRVGG